MDCLPVAGQLMLRLVSAARLVGRILPIVNVPNALFLNRAVVQDNGDRHVMCPAAFIAKSEEAVLNCYVFRRRDRIVYAELVA